MTEDSIETVTLWQGNGHTRKMAEHRLEILKKNSHVHGASNLRIVESYPTGELIIMGDQAVAALACLEKAR